MRAPEWLLFSAARIASAQQYALQSMFPGNTFLDHFSFWTSGDPTFGYVHFVDRETAEQHGMITVNANSTAWGVDTTQVLDGNANLGRLSLRLTSLQSWTHGLFILDLQHMPKQQCGTWPAFWSTGADVQWPRGGEIDIIEYSNTVSNNIMALHTAPGCTIAGADQTGTLVTNDCSAGDGYTGCGVTVTQPNNIGLEFNTASGGVYAMEWTSNSTRLWFFTRDQVPSSISEADDIIGPDPTTFGTPEANFQGSCDIDSHFVNHQLVFDITFCGSWAGNTWAGSGCPLLDPQNGWQSCNDFVALNPGAFTDAYWEANYLKVYQTAAGVPTVSASQLSSVTPVAQTSSISTEGSAALGRTSTPSGTVSPSTTASAAPDSTNPAGKTRGCAGDGCSTATTVVVLQTVTVLWTGPANLEPRDDIHVNPTSGTDPEQIMAHKHLPVPTRRGVAAPTYQTGGTIGFCGVPGSSCNEHPGTHIGGSGNQVDETDPMTTEPPSIVANQHWSHTESGGDSLMLVLPSPIQPHVGPAGIVMVPPKRVAITTSNSSNPTLTVPAYIPTHFSYEPLSGQDVSTSYMVKTITAIVNNYTAVPLYTSTHFSYDPETLMRKSPWAWQTPVLQDSVFDPTATASYGVADVDDKMKRSDTFTSVGVGHKHPHFEAFPAEPISSATCTAVVGLDDDDHASIIGCQAPRSASMTRGEIISTGKFTLTVFGTGFPRTIQPVYGGLMHELTHYETRSDAATLLRSSLMSVLSSVVVVLILWVLV